MGTQVPTLVPALGCRILAATLGGYLCVLHTILTISPLSLCKYQINIWKNGYLFGICKLPSANFFCPAGQVQMQCNSPMPFITTYVGFNYCRSISGMLFITTYVGFNYYRSFFIFRQTAPNSLRYLKFLIIIADLHIFAETSNSL